MYINFLQLKVISPCKRVWNFLLEQGDGEISPAVLKNFLMLSIPYYTCISLKKGMTLHLNEHQPPYIQRCFGSLAEIENVNSNDNKINTITKDEQKLMVS